VVLKRFRHWAAPLASLWIAGATGWQVLGPEPLGIANNGDYSKVSGYYKLAPAVGWGVGESEFYLTDYRFEDRNFYASGLSSSEHFFAWPAVKLSRLWFGKTKFDLRMVGAVKLLWLWGAAAALVWGLAQARYWVALALATLWLSDASTICYLPGFYMDSAALLFAIGLGAASLWWGLGTRWAAVPAIVSAAGLVMSKSQHAPLAFLFALAALGLAWRLRRRWALGVALLFGLLGYGMLRETTSQYAAVPVFTLTFSRIAATGDLLGLDASYQRYVGLHAYSPGSPIEDRQWCEEFLKHVSLGRIAGWYATHPRETLQYLLYDWRRYVGIQPDAGLGWRRQEDGFAARSQAGGLRLLQSLRAATAPWASLLALLAPVLAWGRPGFWPLLLCLSLAGMELGVASLGDMLETARHLYLFQVLIDGLAIASLGMIFRFRP
jgi:hypothetical protein